MQRRVNSSTLRLLAAIPTPPPFSGPETAAALLLETGLGRDIEVRHVRTNVHRRNADKGRVTLASLARFLVAWSRTVWAIVRCRPHVLFIHLSQNRTGFIRDFVFIATGHLTGMCVVAHVHGSNFANFYRTASTPLKRVIEVALRWTDDVIVLADRFRHQFDSLVDRDRLWVVPNAVATNMAPRHPRQGAKCVFLFMAHLSAAKGFLDVVRAAPRVLDRLPNVAFEFAGEWLSDERNIHFDEQARPVIAGDARGEFDRLSAVYGNRVRHLGVVSAGAKDEALHRANVFVLPSYSEGLPMAVLEAMSAELPLVVTPVGALSEILTSEHALFVDAGDVNGLAEVLIELAGDPGRRAAMGAANRALVAERFTPPTVSAALAHCLRTSAARRVQI